VDWLKGDVPLTKVHVLLARRGVHVPYRTLHRFAVGRCGFGAGRQTVRVADGEPGVELQIDFGKMGLIGDRAAGKHRVCWALVFTACYSRHSYVWLTHRQRIEDVIAGCEAAWLFYGGVFRVVIPENVPRNIFGVLFPGALCGQRPLNACRDGVERPPGHITRAVEVRVLPRAHRERGSCPCWSSTSSSRQPWIGGCRGRQELR
jgi:hypothetical protein